MNLYHLKLEVDEKVLKNAEYDIRQYINFIDNSIELLKKKTLCIKIKKHIDELVNGIRYIPEPAKNKSEEKALEILFNENTKNVFDQNQDFKNSGIRVIDQNEDENYIVLEKDIKGDKIYLKPDTYQLEQQKKALYNLIYKPLKEYQPLLNLFGRPDNSVWKQSYNEQNLDWKILTDKTKDGVLEQREFVSKAIQTKDFALMEGPPGSGKTTTIIELIMQFALQGKRILLCSATHAAIDNVIERIKGRYKEICDTEIIPVRISRFEKPVKESVRPYLLKNLSKTYKSEIEKHLKKNNTLESQKFLLENINSNSEQDPIEKIILDSANLVAGTMIGILQHPDIKANKQGASFDVLIVDEASKVTFSDFIVPALHAKKWILVGDVKQLSPYVENDYVSEYIASLLDKNTQKSIVKEFLSKSNKETSYHPNSQDNQEDWAEMVSSRLNQSFSFRNAGEEFSNIDRELEYLLPNEIKDKVMEIKRLVFPSILEMLQNGVGKGTGQRNSRVISDGFSNLHKQSRFTSLSYQHRMHPDIAKTSRENFYENNLLPANTVLENRGWNYALNEPVVKWIHNNDKTGNIKGKKIINPKEVNDIEKELLKFLDWAKNNPKPDGEHYEVAVLTFYLNQESELRKRIRKITKQNNFSKFYKDNTDIFLYTVDKFQGQEADLVLLSFTKFTRDAHFNSPNRLNVALTRARFKLVLFGNKEWFKRSAKLKALRDLATNFESIIRYEK